MKKTLTIIVAVLLVACFCFSLVACNNNDGSSTQQQQQQQQQQQEQQQGGGGSSTTTLTAEQEQIANAFANLASAYLPNNAGSVTQTAITSQLETIRKTDAYKGTVKSVSADIKDGECTVTIIFKNNAKKVLTVALVAADEGNTAGIEFDVGENKTDPANPDKEILGADEAIGILFNAAMATIEDAIEKGSAFVTNEGIGFSAEAYFQFNYGDLTDDLIDFALSVKGNIGFEAAKTDVAIEVKKDGDVIGGLYYDGAATSDACKLYLNVVTDENNFKYYIDNADINKIVKDIIDSASAVIDDIPAMADEDEFYSMRINKLTDLFADIGGDFDVAGIVSDILNDVLTDAVGYKTYDAVLDYVGGMKSLLKGIKLEDLPAPLNQLDLSTFQGVGGALVITAFVNNDGATAKDNTLGALELSYNVGKKDFRFNATDEVAKVYGPVNVALGVKDYSIGEQTAVIPKTVFVSEKEDDNGYTYFSPLNFEISSIVRVDNDVYDIHVSSEANPFVLQDAVATIDIDKNHEDFASVSFEMDDDFECFIVLKNGNNTYQGYASDLDFETPFGIIGDAIVGNENIFGEIVAYVNELKAMFEDDQKPAGADEVEETSDEFNPMSLVNAFNEIKALVEGWNGEVYTYGEYKDGGYYFKGEVAAAQYDAVLDIVMPKLAGLAPEDVITFRFGTTVKAPTIYANYNYNDVVKGDYTDKAVVIVTYDGEDYIALLDMTGFDFNTGKGTLVGSFEMNDTLYKGVLEIKDNGATFVYTVKEGEADDITYIDFAFNYVEDATAETPSTVTLKLKTDVEVHEYVLGAYKADDLYYFTANLDGDNTLKVYGGKGSFKYENVGKTSFNIPCIEMGCVFGWDFPASAHKVSIDSIKLESWGEAVSVSANEPAEDAKAINEFLNEVAEDVAAIFTYPVAE